jgi:hypothetical protein
MAQLFSWLSSNAGLGILGAAIAFIFSTVMQVLQRRAELREREFQAFHKLVRDLVAPHRSGEAAQGMDAQAAIVFELRHFHRYHEFTQRLLVRLKNQWEKDPRSRDLIEEIDFTLRQFKTFKTIQEFVALIQRK